MWKARFIRWLHCLGWSFRPWLWEKCGHIEITVYDHRNRVVKVLCDCGKEWR